MTKENDIINHPSHYNTGLIEVIDFIEDKKLCFSLGSAVKYISRAGHKHKDREIEDLNKADWFVKRKMHELRSRSDIYKYPFSALNIFRSHGKIDCKMYTVDKNLTDNLSMAIKCIVASRVVSYDEQINLLDTAHTYILLEINDKRA